MALHGAWNRSATIILSILEKKVSQTVSFVCKASFPQDKMRSDRLNCIWLRCTSHSKVFRFPPCSFNPQNLQKSIQVGVPKPGPSTFFSSRQIKLIRGRGGQSFRSRTNWPVPASRRVQYFSAAITCSLVKRAFHKTVEGEGGRFALTGASDNMTMTFFVLEVYIMLWMFHHLFLTHIALLCSQCIKTAITFDRGDRMAPLR